MWKSLFRRTPGTDQNIYTVPDGTTVYAVGDIHGRLDLLQELEDRIVADAARRDGARRVLVYLGDYVDRGYESRGVIEHFLAGGPPDFERVFLMGNHEDYMLRFLSDPSVARSWFANGGIETLMSYGVVAGGVGGTDADAARVQAEFRDAVPETHRTFIAGLPVSHREGDYLFVHAGIRPGVELEKQDPEDLKWIRSDFLNDKRDYGLVVVHGHTVEDKPVDRPNRVGIDTGAYATSRLTSVVLTGATREFIST